MLGRHEYEVEVEWLGDRCTGTSGYRDYSRRHVVQVAGKAAALGGDSSKFLPYHAEARVKMYFSKVYRDDGSGLRGPSAFATKPNWSAMSSICIHTGLPAPCPARVSMRISTGFGHDCTRWSSAANL